MRIIQAVGGGRSLSDLSCLRLNIAPPSEAKP